MRTYTMGFLLAGFMCFGHAQELKKSTGWLSISTVPTEAELFVDGQYLGKSPLSRVEVDTGKHTLRAFYPALTAWNGSSKVEEVVVGDGHETTMKLELENTVSLTSIPSGVEVHYEGQTLGLTPILFKTTRALSGSIALHQDGYETAYVPVSGSGYVGMTVRLNRLNSREAWSFSDVLSSDSNGEPVGQWVNYVAGTAMIFSGFLAAYYKDHANREFENYERTKDPGSLSSVRRFDKLSGVSFTITQLSFAVLAYKLLVE
ncbi:MAG: PEGA domain-containing protein [Ignavibacteriales bacterium]|nr:PEGA domain-containing protein [Ignavibacteriales bacterium]